MLEDHSLAAVEFGHQFIEARITEEYAVGTAQQHHPVGPEHVERFPAGIFGDWYGQDGEAAEAIAELCAGLGREFVAGAR